MLIMPPGKLRRGLVTTMAVLALAILSPAALAGHADRYGGHGRVHVQRSHVYRSHAYRPRVYRYNSHHRYSAYRAPVRYGHYRHNHWGPGEVLGAVVAGAILTNVISDAFEPRTTIVERRVYRDDYPDYSRETRYIGPDNGYYEDRR